MEQNSTAVAVIQENNATLRSKISLPNYTIIRKDRGRLGGGLAFMVSNNTQYRTIDFPPPADSTTIEQQPIAVTPGSTEIQRMCTTNNMLSTRVSGQ